MIWVVHPNQDGYEAKLNEVRSTGCLTLGRIRIVANMNELREKVSCLEAGRDDRTIELCKIFVESQLFQQRPDFIAQTSFYSYFEGKSIVFLYDEHAKELQCEITDDIYNLVEVFLVKL